MASAALGGGCAGGVRPPPPLVPTSPAPDPSTAIVRVPIETPLSDTALIRQHIAQAWATGAAAQAISALAEPVAVGEEAWLVITPRHFGLGPSSGSGAAGVSTGLALSAGLRIVVGSAPPPAAVGQLTADTVAADSAFEVIVPIDVPYSLVRTQLAREFRLDSGGIRIPETGPIGLRPTAVAITGDGSRVVTRVDFAGTAKGVLYLVGTPQLDTLTWTVLFPDLTYSLETKNLLLKAASRIKGADLEADLRMRLRLELAPQLTAVESELAYALTRTSGLVQLEGQVAHFRVLDVFSQPDINNLRLYVAAKGTLRAAVR